MEIHSSLIRSVEGNNELTHYITGSRLLANIGELLGKKYDYYLLLTDDTVSNIYSSKIEYSIKKLNRVLLRASITPGETNKNIQVFINLAKHYLSSGFSRNSVLISCGGGVVCDIGNFLSAVLLRGINSVLVPTTLLSQIDAAIGGKGGVDITVNGKMFKNMIGIIRQPTNVITDIDTLKTLPQKEIVNGLGEMIKYSLGWGKPQPDYLLNFNNLLKNNWQTVSSIITVCQKLKLAIIAKDPQDKLHYREQLNLGHTIGHALEGLSEGELSHGQAVALGIIAAAKYSLLLNFITDKTFQEIKKLIAGIGLPTKIKIAKIKEVIDMAKHDKKDGLLIVFKGIGKLTTVKWKPLLLAKSLKEIAL